MNDDAVLDAILKQKNDRLTAHPLKSVVIDGPETSPYPGEWLAQADCANCDQKSFIRYETTNSPDAARAWLDRAVRGLFEQDVASGAHMVGK